MATRRGLPQTQFVCKPRDNDFLPGCHRTTCAEGYDSADTLGLFPGDSAILSGMESARIPWRLYTRESIYTKLAKWRHNNACVTAWVPGNVTRIKKVPINVGIDYRCYTGEMPDRMPPSF